MSKKDFFSVRMESDTLTMLEELTDQLAVTIPENGQLLSKEDGPKQYRRVLFGTTMAELLTGAQQRNQRRMLTFSCMKEPVLVFVFPGLGAQYVHMGRGLYEKSAIFRDELDKSLQLLLEISGCDIYSILFPENEEEKQTIDEPLKAQLANFLFSYSLSRTLLRHGVEPDEMIGYSFGEYVAGCISGIFNLEQAIRLIIRRGEIIEKAATGRMYSVPLSAIQLKPLLGPEIYIAIDNGDSCVVAGTIENMPAFEHTLKANRLIATAINSSCPLHTPLMEQAGSEYLEYLQTQTLQPPVIPFISGVTGTYITNKQAMDPNYWVGHLTSTIQFNAGLKTLTSTPNKIFLEVGAGRDMTMLLTAFLNDNQEFKSLNLVRSREQAVDDYFFFSQRMLILWLYGHTSFLKEKN